MSPNRPSDQRPHDPASPHESPTAHAAFSRPESHVGEQAGDRVGPYHLLERIGEGGFGSVFLAEQTEPVRRRVALKILKPGMDSVQIIARFEAERQALAIMDHPHIARIFDAGATEKGRPYFAMEHVPGVPITEHCDRLRLTIRQRLTLFTKVCNAIAHAHTKGIIHRDLKPSNILVYVRETDDGVPKVIDFGVAKATQHRLTEHTFFTEHGMLIGTPEYMSPEQAEMTAQDVDTRTDVYSLGVILYELLTGALPFDPKSLRAAGYDEIRRIIREVEPPRPSTRLTQAGAAAGRLAEARRARLNELTRELRSELEWIPLKAMRKDRSERYRSPQELADDVRNYLAGNPLIAAPESSAYRIRKFVSRNRAPVAIAALFSLAIVIGLAGTINGLIRASQARAEAESVTDFLADMLASVTPDERGRDVTVREILDRSAGAIATRLPGHPIAQARIRHTIGNSYRGLGVLDRAAEHLEAAWQSRRDLLGPRHRDTVRSLGDLASIRLEQGRYDDAQKLSLEAISLWPDDPNDRIALGLKNNLATIYSRKGMLEEAERLQRETLEAQRRSLGESHPDTLGSTMNLAGILSKRGDTKQAEDLLLRVVEAWRRTQGPEHPGTLLAVNELAGLYLDLQRNPEAEKLYRESLAAQRAVLGPDHPSTARTETNLATTILLLGKAEEAESLYLQAWQTQRRNLGDAHDHTISAAASLMGLYQNAGWPQRAADKIPGLIATMKARSVTPGTSADTLNTCAWFLVTVEPSTFRDPAAALAASSLACQTERANRGNQLWTYLDTLALAQHLTGDHAAAAQTQQEAMSLIPRNGEQYRAEMQQRLTEYLTAQNAPPK